MKPADFAETNAVFSEHQPQYERLPAHRFKGDEQGRIAFCWQLSWRERFRVLLTGRVWQQTLTFGITLQPQLLSADKPEMGVTQ